MNTGSERYNNAIKRLYSAYVEGRLNPMDCKKCAVGNICNNTSRWQDFICLKGEVCTGSSLVEFNEYMRLNNAPYSGIELRNIERIYMSGCRLGGRIDIEIDKSCLLREKRPDHLNLRALLLVIDYLGELEGFTERKDIKDLFESKELVV